MPRLMMSIEAIRFTNTSVKEIGIDNSFRYPPDEYLDEDDLSRQYQSKSNISYYVIPHGHSLTEITQSQQPSEECPQNESNPPLTEVVKDYHVPSNIEETNDKKV
ncbi:hypothetical protein Tco_0229459 [Tanacetum coccineum]